jgi:hypothetical protein
MFSRAILVKTWKQKFCTNKVKIPICKNILNAYRITKMRTRRLDIIASAGRANVQQFLFHPSPRVCDEGICKDTHFEFEQGMKPLFCTADNLKM